MVGKDTEINLKSSPTNRKKFVLCEKYMHFPLKFILLLILQIKELQNLESKLYIIGKGGENDI